MKKLLSIILLYPAIIFSAPPQPENWELIFEDNFDYLEETYAGPKFDDIWYSQNCENPKLLCSRWRENVAFGNGVLKILNKKERKNGSNQDWTSALIRTKQKFCYGYFEARYKYTPTSGANNAFWIYTMGSLLSEGIEFEIDINEGYYPNRICTQTRDFKNTVNTMTMGKINPGVKKVFKPGGSKGEPLIKIKADKPIFAKKLRFSSNHISQINLREIYIYAQNAKTFHNPLYYDETTKPDKNLARYSKTTSNSGVYKDSKIFTPDKAFDGNPGTQWASQIDGEKFIEFELPEKSEIGYINILAGWKDAGVWENILRDYKVEYLDNDNNWVLIIDKQSDYDESVNLSKGYHTYALEWNKDELIFYFDGKEYYRTRNEFCNSPAFVCISNAIAEWAGPIIEKDLDGSSMDVDYIRIYKRIK